MTWANMALPMLGVLVFMVILPLWSNSRDAKKERRAGRSFDGSVGATGSVGGCDGGSCGGGGGV